jgi:hypothetical protein
VSYNAFYLCKKLVSAEIPDVSRLESEAFYGCSALEYVDISGANDLKLSDQYDIFRDCKNLKSIKLPAIPPKMQYNRFVDVPTSCVLYIPRGSLASYQQAQTWSDLTSQYSFVEEDR